MDEAPDYSKYTLNQLWDEFQCLNTKRYPDRFAMVCREIRRRREGEGLEPEDLERAEHKGFWRRLWSEYAGTVDADKHSWKTRDFFLGILVLLLFVVLGRFLNNVQFFAIRPWLITPVFLLANPGLSIALIIFTIWIYKKRGLWPIMPSFNASVLLKESLRSVWYLLIAVLCCVPVIVILRYGLSLEVLSKNEGYLRSGSPSMLMIIMLFEMFTLGPIAEELFFRGFLYNALKSRVGIVFAVIIQAAIFALCHNDYLAWSAVIFVLGIALAIIYEKRKTLLTPILVHMMKNALVAIPLLFLALQNYYLPAKTFEEARISPHWLKSVPSEEIERQDSGLNQWQYAIDKWGSKGSRQWKKEANAFHAVYSWFPEDRSACAKARTSIANIYLTRLNDYRRGIVEADGVLRDYPEQREYCAYALCMRGWAYYALMDFKKSRESFDKIIEEFKEYEKDYNSSQKGIRWLNILEKKAGG